MLRKNFCGSEREQSVQPLLKGNTNTFGGKAVTRRLANRLTVATQANELSRNGGRNDDVQVLGGAANDKAPTTHDGRTLAQQSAAISAAALKARH